MNAYMKKKVSFKFLNYAHLYEWKNCQPFYLKCPTLSFTSKSLKTSNGKIKKRSIITMEQSWTTGHLSNEFVVFLALLEIKVLSKKRIGSWF